MTKIPADSEATRRRTASSRITLPVAPELRRAGLLSVAAGMIWPLQAVCIAWTVSGWVEGTAGLDRAMLAALAFVLGGLLRALLEYHSAGILFNAADRIVARERALLLDREARAPGPAGSAAIGAMIAQKLPMLQPWITRYHVAQVRVTVLPLLLLAISFYFSWAIGLVLMVAGPLIPVFMALVGMAAEDASRRQLDEIGTMNDMLLDRLSAMLDIRLLGAGARAAADFADRAEDLRSRTMAVLKIAFLSSTVLELFAAIGVAMVAVFVGFSLLGAINFGSWGRPLGLAEGLFLLLIAPEFFQPMRDFAAAWHDRAAGLSVVAELEALDAAPRVSIVGEGIPATALAGVMSVRLTGGGVAFADRTLELPDIELSAGEAIALTGPSGSGKSTTLAVIAGLMPLARGQLQVCGEALSPENADAWRARLTVMPQNPHFADVALRDFLDPRNTGNDPWPALDVAEARGIVERLPGGLDTRLGETGGGVSGGEARRLMIARVVVSGGDLLIADEPTADLDPVTAAHVIKALQKLKASGCAMIVATHDPVLIASLDRVVEIRGRVVEVPS